MEIEYDSSKVKSEHRTWDDEGVTSTLVVDEVEQGADELSKKRKKPKGFDEEQTIMKLSFPEARRLLLRNRKNGLKLMEDKRHITIGWHQAGRGIQAIKKILDQSVGQFRESLGAVPLAIGRISVPPYAEVVGSQSCMHTDVTARMIVFQPEVGKIYKCLVTSVNKQYLTAKIFNTISFIAPVHEVLKVPSVGDSVWIKFLRFSVRGNMCQMKGTICTGKK